MFRTLLLLSVIFLLPTGTSWAEGPSFDCAKAATKVEKMICADAELSRLDVELATAYVKALGKASSPAALKQWQRKWLQGRNRCTDAACLRTSYQVRQNELNKLLAANIPKPLDADDGGICLEPQIDWRDYAWVLINGKGRPACEDMLTYLQSRPIDAPPPVCPEDRLPPGPEWVRPQGRDLTKAERQVLLDGLPDYQRYKAKQESSIEWAFMHAKLMRVLHVDISRDGIPEYLLAYATHDYRQECKRATQCAVTREGPAQGGVSIGYGDSYYYAMQPLNAEGTQIPWGRRPAGYPPMLMGGELIYYKGRPYWLSFPSWSQKIDGRLKSARPITDPYGKMFLLNEIYVGTGKQGEVAPNFKDVIGVAVDHRPESPNVCRFGYFNRVRIKHDLPSGGE